MNGKIFMGGGYSIASPGLYPAFRLYSSDGSRIVIQKMAAYLNSLAGCVVSTLPTNDPTFTNNNLTALPLPSNLGDQESSKMVIQFGTVIAFPAPVNANHIVLQSTPPYGINCTPIILSGNQLIQFAAGAVGGTLNGWFQWFEEY